MVVSVVVSSLVFLIVHIRIFTYVHGSSRHMTTHTARNLVQCNVATKSTQNTTTNQPRLVPRERRLLLYMIFMFLTFIIGWGPFYTMMIFISTMQISGFISIYLLLVGEISLNCVVISLFLFNKELRKYYKDLILQRS
jgi:cellulose synthase/poly-beta-1,6-N-acetylglucosamine synthase-like glycosyltransferase